MLVDQPRHLRNLKKGARTLLIFRSFPSHPFSSQQKRNLDALCVPLFPVVLKTDAHLRLRQTMLKINALHVSEGECSVFAEVFL